MSTVVYFKNHCALCGGSIEFPAYGVGTRIRCPHCAREIELVASESPTDQNAAARQKVYLALKDRGFEAACLRMAEFEALQPHSRGLGMNWKKYDPAYDLSILQSIFSARIKRQIGFDESILEIIRIAAGMMHLWGESKPSPWLPDDIYPEGIDWDDLPPGADIAPVISFATEAYAILSHALETARITQMKEAGIESVRTLTARLGNECPVCRAEEERLYHIDDCPVLPHEGCSCKNGCKCVALSVMPEWKDEDGL